MKLLPHDGKIPDVETMPCRSVTGPVRKSRIIGGYGPDLMKILSADGIYIDRLIFFCLNCFRNL
jgi:hypothetical protein